MQSGRRILGFFSSQSEQIRFSGIITYMSVISFSFLFFLATFGFLYFLLPKKFQWTVLLAGNLVFYAFSGWQYLVYLLSCTFFTWFVALQIEKNTAELKSELAAVSNKEEKAALRMASGKKKRLWITSALVLTLGVWIVLKYGPFLLDSFAALFKIPDLQGALRFIVPLGMSFYTFDAISYMIDVSRGKYGAEKNFFKYLTFVSYFPHIIQGPFSRFDKLGKTLYSEHRFSYDRLCQGASRILWGYFKKLIIADKLAITVNEIFSNYQNYWGIHILFVMVLYALQLYADFSGYIDIVSGISHILGIDLAQNFRQPYFSTSVEEFWRRWHMTLGAWFRDYLFYPISRSEKARKIRNRFCPEIAKHLVNFIAMFWVWSASGLWHGANWTFLIWGWLNMLIMWFSQILEPLYQKSRDLLHISLSSKIWHGFRILRTFCIVCFLFFITRADSVQTIPRMLHRLQTGMNRKLLLYPLELFPKMQQKDVYVATIGLSLMFIVDILSETKKWETVKTKTPFTIRNLIYVFMIFLLILFSGTEGDITSNFIYANF